MSTDTDPFGYRERINEEAQRQLEMLRVTLTERIAERDVLMAELPRDMAPIPHAAYKGAREAYADVLSLLGPEPAWWTDPDSSEPF